VGRSPRAHRDSYARPLAPALALTGVHAAVVERRARQELDGSPWGGLHSRTIEVLDQGGIADRFLAEEQAMRRWPSALGAGPYCAW
jgi:2-polyprenyl-6-methoxyphenol hydroxylase-like FAD-dependent oxidoreductase